MENKVLKNTSWMIIAGISESLISFVVSILTVRYLGPSNYGLIGYAKSLVTIILPFCNLGFNSVMVKEVINNKDNEGEIVGTIMTFSFVSSIVCYLAMICFAYFVNAGDKETLIVCLLYGISILLNGTRLLDYWVQAKQLIKYTSISSIVIYVVISAYKMFLLITGKSVYWFAASNSLDTLLLSIILVIIYKKNSSDKLSFDYQTGLKLLKVSKYYIVLTAMHNVFANMDSVMIKGMLGNEANGLYGSAINTALLTYFVFNSIYASYNPQILEYKACDNNKAYEQSLINLYSIVFYLFLAQAIFCTIFSKFIINTLYGSAYLGASSIFQVLIFSKLFDYLGSCRNIYILAEEKHKDLLVVNAFSIVLNIILNYYFINCFGVIGAAYATIITSIFNNVICGFVIKSLQRNNKLLIKSLNPLVFIQNLKVVFHLIFK